jgi:1,4-dihydroxy-2-naphthoate octaprenyltransferase
MQPPALAGIALGTLYSMPPVQLRAHGFSEAALALAFGTLPVAGAAWLQSGIVDTDVLLASVPISLWVAAILLTNEVPDIKHRSLTASRRHRLRPAISIERVTGPMCAWRKTKLQPGAHHALLSKSLFPS